MSSTPITFDVSQEALAALDHAVTEQHRDRSSILRDALEQYLSLEQYHRDEIEEGIRQADAGDLIDHETVVAQFEDWKRQAGIR